MSVLNQSYCDYEVIIIDDGSTDGTFEEISKYGLLDDRVIIKQNCHNGTYYTRNEAINIAKGDYICFLDSDDYYELSFLEQVSRYILEYDYPDIVTFGVIYVTGEREYNHNIIENPLVLESSEYLKKCLNIGRIYTSLCNKVIKRSLMFNGTINIEGRTITYCEDQLRLIPIICNSSTILAISNPYYYYYLDNSTSATKSIGKSKLIDQFVVLTKINHYVNERIKNNKNDYVEFYDRIVDSFFEAISIISSSKGSYRSKKKDIKYCYALYKSIEYPTDTFIPKKRMFCLFLIKIRIYLLLFLVYRVKLILLNK